jgi:hypothetical protein
MLTTRQNIRGNLNFFSKNTSTYLSSLYLLSFPLTRNIFVSVLLLPFFRLIPFLRVALSCTRIIAPEGRRGVAIKQNRLADLMIPEATWQQISSHLPIIAFISLSYRTYFYYTFLSFFCFPCTLLFYVMTFFSSGNLFCFFSSFDFLVPRCNY